MQEVDYDATNANNIGDNNHNNIFGAQIQPITAHLDSTLEQLQKKILSKLVAVLLTLDTLKYNSFNMITKVLASTLELPQELLT